MSSLAYAGLVALLALPSVAMFFVLRAKLQGVPPELQPELHDPPNWCETGYMWRLYGDDNAAAADVLQAWEETMLGKLKLTPNGFEIRNGQFPFTGPTVWMLFIGGLMSGVLWWFDAQTPMRIMLPMVWLLVLPIMLVFFYFFAQHTRSDGPAARLEGGGNVIDLNEHGIRLPTDRVEAVLSQRRHVPTGNQETIVRHVSLLARGDDGRYVFPILVASIISVGTPTAQKLANLLRVPHHVLPRS
jgi:hypothetical protein